ncbi:hypothetical protein X975_16589, partial [Stegodyphus mimosarum]
MEWNAAPKTAKRDRSEGYTFREAFTVVKMVVLIEGHPKKCVLEEQATGLELLMMLTTLAILSTKDLHLSSSKGLLDFYKQSGRLKQIELASIGYGNQDKPCYFCVTNVTGHDAKNKGGIVNPNLPSAIRSIGYNAYLSVPHPQANMGNISDIEIYSNFQVIEEEEDLYISETNKTISILIKVSLMI